MSIEMWTRQTDAAKRADVLDSTYTTFTDMIDALRYRCEAQRPACPISFVKRSTHIGPLHQVAGSSSVTESWSPYMPSRWDDLASVHKLSLIDCIATPPSEMTPHDACEHGLMLSAQPNQRSSQASVD